MVGQRIRKQLAAHEPQLELELELQPRRLGRGGARVGAGRKKLRGRRDSPHRTRPAHKKWQPVHVVMRTLKSVPRLRRRKVFEAVRRAFRAICDKQGFRIVHLSIQHNHLHFLVEANDRDALAHGMQSLNISLARQINKACGRRGKVFAQRFHARRSPRRGRRATRSHTC